MPGLWHSSCIRDIINKGGKTLIMGSKAIKVIKKSSKAFESPAISETVSIKSSTRKAVHSIEENIKGWIEELKGRKHDELVQAHSLLGGI